MSYLIDTAVFLWMIFDHRDKISKTGLKIVSDPSNTLILSAASVWEISIKYHLGKLALEKPPQKWLPQVIQEMGLKELDVISKHALLAGALKQVHKDPFDRLLIAQSKSENTPIISPDRIFKKYPVKLVW